MGFFSKLLGDDAAAASKAAAADTYKKQQEAAAASKQAGSDYLSGLMQTSHGYDPYVQGGQSAYAKLLQGLGLGGQGGQEAFAQGYQNLPGYQSGLDTGTRAVTSRLNAGPGTQSGAAQKALYRYGSDYENQHSNDYLTRLMGLGQQGFGATQGQTGLQAQGYGGQLQANLGAANQMFGSAPTIGQGDVAAAQAQATGLGNVLNLGSGLLGMGLGSLGGGGAFGKFGAFSPNGFFGSSFGK